MTQSLFAFTFRLGPWEACLNLNFDQEELAPGFAAVCTRDHLGILWSGDAQEFQGGSSAAYGLARALIHADAYVTYPGHLVLEVEPVTWLEIRDCSTTGCVSGYMHHTVGTAPLDPKHPDRARLCRAVRLVREVQQHPSLGLALTDFYTARRELGPYSAFYAFRVLEDIGFHFGVAKGDKPNWKAMNDALGTTESKWRPLTDAGTAARHLSEQKRPSLAAANIATLLALARESIELTFKKLSIE